MSKFIDNAETFDLTSLTGVAYSEKIDGLLKRFPKYERYSSFRTVLPNKLPKTADDYISMKFCTQGRVPIYGIYTRRDLDLVGVCVDKIMFALDHASTHFHSSFVPDLNVRKVHLGIQDTPLASAAYSEKIDGLLKRFPKYERDSSFRTVLPNKLPKTADDYISMKFCTQGRVPIYGIYTRRDLDLVGVCVDKIMFALDHASTHFHSSFVPDLNVRKVHLGIQDTPLATHETLNYTKPSMRSAISTLSLGYTPEKKNEWCDAIVLLTGMTSQAVRFHDMNYHIRTGLNRRSNVNRFVLDNLYLATQNRWNKISKAIRKGDYPYVFSYYMNHGMYTTKSVSEFFARDSVSLINEKDKTKQEKSRRKICKWNGPVGKRKRKRKEERRRSWLMQRTERVEAPKSNQIMKMDNNSERMHGLWYGSVDTFNYDVDSVKCLLRPAHRFLISAISHLDRLKDVLQIQRTPASILLADIKISNEGGLLAFSRGTSLILERWGSHVVASGSYLWFRRPRPYPSLRAATHGSIADCTYPLFTAAAFYLCAKRQKVSTSVKGLCFYHFGISKAKIDPTISEWNQGPVASVKLGWGRISGATCEYPLQVISSRSRVHAQHSSTNAGYIGISYVF